MKIFKKENGELKMLFKSEGLDWCSLVSGKSKSFFFLKYFLKSTKKNAPDLYHNCPYSGVHKISNISTSRQYLLIFPVGEFQYEVELSKKSKKIIDVEYNFKTT